MLCARALGVFVGCRTTGRTNGTLRATPREPAPRRSCHPCASLAAAAAPNAAPKSPRPSPPDAGSAVASVALAAGAAVRNRSTPGAGPPAGTGVGAAAEAEGLSTPEVGWGRGGGTSWGEGSPRLTASVCCHRGANGRLTEEQ